MTERERRRRRAAARRTVEKELGVVLHPDYWRTIEAESYNSLRDEEDVREFEADHSPGSRNVRQLHLLVESLRSGGALDLGPPQPRFGPERPRVIARQVYLVDFVSTRSLAITLANLARRSFLPRGRISWQDLCWKWNEEHNIPQYTERSMDKAFRRAIRDSAVCARYFELMQEEEAKALRWIAGTPSGDLDPECQRADLEAAANRLATLYYLSGEEGEGIPDDYDMLESALSSRRIKNSGEDFLAAVRFYAWWWAKTKSAGQPANIFPVFHPEPYWIVRMREILRPEWERMNQSASSGGNGRESNERQH